jgi:hypothetical protein
MPAITANISSGPDWATIITAFGTVGAVVAAVGIAVVSARNANKLAQDEREKADARLDRQIRHSDEQLQEERKHSDEQLAAERADANQRMQQQFDKTEELEQRSQAAAIVILDCRLSAEPRRNLAPDPNDPPGRAAVLIVNRSKYAITGLAVRLVVQGRSIIELGKRRRLGDLDIFPEHWTVDITGMLGEFPAGLAPGSAIRFESDNMPDSVLGTSFVIVRWTDRWDKCWEHRRGEVFPTDMAADWLPGSPSLDHSRGLDADAGGPRRLRG